MRPHRRLTQSIGVRACVRRLRGETKETRTVSGPKRVSANTQSLEKKFSATFEVDRACSSPWRRSR